MEFAIVELRTRKQIGCITIDNDMIRTELEATGAPNKFITPDVPLAWPDLTHDPRGYADMNRLWRYKQWVKGFTQHGDFTDVPNSIYVTERLFIDGCMWFVCFNKVTGSSSSTFSPDYSDLGIKRWMQQDNKQHGAQA